MIAFFFYVADLLRGEDLEDLGETCVESSGVFVFCVSQVEGRDVLNRRRISYSNFFEEPHVHPSRVLIFLYEHLVSLQSSEDVRTSPDRTTHLPLL